MRNKLIYGVGINDANYVVQQFETVGYVDGKRKQKQVWVCPFYQTWKHMLERSYCNKYKEKQPTYIDVLVCKEWWLFSNFKQWMEEQPFEGMQLDKDLLVKGNKEYSANACVFVPTRINTLLIDSGSARGDYPLGVYYQQKSKGMVSELKKPYIAQVNKGEGKRQKYLGTFATRGEAHKAWQLAKADVINTTVDWWKTEVSVNHTYRQDVADALLERSNKLRYDAEYNIETQEL